MISMDVCVCLTGCFFGGGGCDTEVYFVPIRDSGYKEAAPYCTHCETVSWEMNCSSCLSASMKDPFFFFISSFFCHFEGLRHIFFFAATQLLLL